MTPTRSEIRHEIERGPLAARLAPHWGRVFEAPPEDDPVPDGASAAVIGRMKAAARANAVKRQRVGGLHPDAAFDIVEMLQKSGRVEALGWALAPWMVTDAKGNR